MRRSLTDPSVNGVVLLGFDEIDGERMLSICDRLNKPVARAESLSNDELYVAWHLTNKPLYMMTPGIAPREKDIGSLGTQQEIGQDSNLC